MEILKFLETESAAVVMLILAVATLWTTLRLQITRHLAALTDRLNQCESRHGKCERRNKQLAEAVLDLLRDDRESAQRNVTYVLQQRDEDY